MFKILLLILFTGAHGYGDSVQPDGYGQINNGIVSGQIVIKEPSCEAQCGRGSKCVEDYGEIVCTACPRGKKLDRDRNTCLFLGKWSQWSKCSVTCGQGIKQRERKCSRRQQKYCLKSAPQKKQCSANQECHGEWSSWGEWGKCSQSCGEGFRRRFRKCLERDSGSSLGCIGKFDDWQACRYEACTSKLSEWAQWSTCTPCGKGTQARTRTCLTKVGNLPCAGALLENRQCQGVPCPASNCLRKYGQPIANDAKTEEPLTGGVGNVRYHCFNTPVHWQTAHDDCRRKNMNLAMPKSRSTLDYIRRQCGIAALPFVKDWQPTSPWKDFMYWIGAKSNDVNQPFYYLDGTDVKCDLFFPGQPDEFSVFGRQTCLAGNVALDNAECTFAKFQYVCEERI